MPVPLLLVRWKMERKRGGGASRSYSSTAAEHTLAPSSDRAAGPSQLGFSGGAGTAKKGYFKWNVAISVPSLSQLRVFFTGVGGGMAKAIHLA